MEDVLFQDVSTRDYARVFFRHKAIVFLVVLIAVIVSGVYSYLVLPQFEASAKILLSAQESNPPTPTSEKLSPFRQGVEHGATQAALIQSTAIMGDVVKYLDLHNRPKPEGIRGSIKVAIDEIKEKISDLYTELKGSLLALITGKKKQALVKPTKFEKEVYRLSSGKIVRIEQIERTDLITIKVKDYDAKMSARIANAVAKAYVIYDLRLQLEDFKKEFRASHPRVVKLAREIAQAEGELQSEVPLSIEELAGKVTSGDVKIVQSAAVPVRPVSPKKLLTVVLAAVLGLFVGIGYIFLREILEQTLKTSRNIQDVLGLKVFGAIPRLRTLPRSFPLYSIEIFQLQREMEMYNGAIKDVASQLYHLRREKNLKSFLLASDDSKDGKTTLTLSIASALASISEGKVLVIDADVSSSDMHRVLNLQHTLGVVEIAKGNMNWRDAVIPVSSYKISVIPAGLKHTLHPEGTLSSENVGKFLKEAREEYDFVLIDTTSLRENKSLFGLAGSVDSGIYIAKAYSTRKHVARSSCASLQEAQIALTGCILNFREDFIPEAIYKRL